MHEQVDFITINAVPQNEIQIVFSFYIRTAMASGEPLQFILSAALNRQKANTDRCEFPIYIPAVHVYHSEAHKKLLELLRSNAPWVPVECQNFKVYRYQNKENCQYFAHADNFKVADYSKITEV